GGGRAGDASEDLVEGVLDVRVDVDPAGAGCADTAAAEDVQPEVEGTGLPGRGGGLSGSEGREDGDEDGRRDHRGRVDVPRDGGGKPRAARGDRGVPGELGDDREGSEEQEGRALRIKTEATIRSSGEAFVGASGS